MSGEQEMAIAMLEREPPVKIFIAASASCKDAAEEFTSHLLELARQGRRERKDTIHGEAASHNAIDLTPVRWWDRREDSYLPSTLLVEIKECAFGVFILDENNENCIYEAGFLSGDFGDPKRCFLLSERDVSELPTDLRGLNVISLSKNANGQVNVKENPLAEAAQEVWRYIQDLADNDRLRPIKGLRIPVLSFDEIIRRGRSVPEGGVLQELSTCIFLNTLLPEARDDFFSRVVKNMKNGVQYVYVFDASDVIVGPIARFVVGLAWSGEGADEAAFESSLEVLRQCLGIYFLPDRSGFGLRIQCFFYNATDPNRAVCYVRSPRWTPAIAEAEWMEWSQGIQAMDLAGEIYKNCDEGKHVKVFGSTRYFDIYSSDNERYVYALQNEMRLLLRKTRKRAYSGELENKLISACFGEHVIKPDEGIAGG